MSFRRISDRFSTQKLSTCLLFSFLFIGCPSYAQSQNHDIFIGWSLYNYRPQNVRAVGGSLVSQYLNSVRLDVTLGTARQVPFVLSGTFSATDFAVESAYGFKPNVLRPDPLVIGRLGVRPGKSFTHGEIHFRAMAGIGFGWLTAQQTHCDGGGSSGEADFALPLRDDGLVEWQSSLSDLERSTRVDCFKEGSWLVLEFGPDFEMKLSDNWKLRAFVTATSTAFGDKTTQRQWGPEFGAGLVRKF